MSRFWSPIVARLQPYTPGEQPRVEGMIKLNTNENPYGPSPRVTAALRALDPDDLRRYPDPQASALRAALAQRFALTPAHVFVGNGSDEVLAHIFHALLQHERPLFMPDLTYSFYPTYARLYGVAYEEVPLRADLSLAVEDYRRDAGAIILPNPNAPTGRLLPLSALRQLLVEHPQEVVVIDEAYIDFGGESAASLIAEFEQLVVVQTFSKSWSLAGARVGFALAQPHLIEALERVKNSFNSYPLDRWAQVAAQAALSDTAWFNECCGRVIGERERLTTALTALAFEVLPSAANFLFVRHAVGARRLLAALRERRIFVRHFAGGRSEDWLRISVGQAAENDALLAALHDIIAAAPPAPETER